MDTPTIYDVSRLSGVSTATVSRTFTTPDRVRESTRRRVYAAAEALHYQPSAIARAMARQQTDKIAFLICKEGATILDEFYASICEGVMRRANGTNYQLLISTAEEWTRTAQSKQIEGVILAGNAQADLISEFQRQNIPVVLVNNRAAGFDLPCIVADEAGGVRQVVSHLISAGHQRIAMLMGRFSPYVTSARYNAFLSVMRENGLSVDESGALMCDRDIQSATEAALRLLSRPDRPSAVFAFNDVLAAGVMKAARRLGLRLPHDGAGAQLHPCGLPPDGRAVYGAHGCIAGRCAGCSPADGGAGESQDPGILPRRDLTEILHRLHLGLIVSALYKMYTLRWKTFFTQ